MDDRFPEDPDLAFHPLLASEGHLSQWQGSCVASRTSLLQRSHIQFWDEITISKATGSVIASKPGLCFEQGPTNGLELPKGL